MPLFALFILGLNISFCSFFWSCLFCRGTVELPQIVHLMWNNGNVILMQVKQPHWPVRRNPCSHWTVILGSFCMDGRSIRHLSSAQTTDGQNVLKTCYFDFDRHSWENHMCLRSQFLRLTSTWMRSGWSIRNFWCFLFFNSALLHFEAQKLQNPLLINFLL